MSPLTLALSVFALSGGHQSDTFCYAQLRSLEGRTLYDRPSLPREAAGEKAIAIPLLGWRVPTAVLGRRLDFGRGCRRRRRAQGRSFRVPDRSPLLAGFQLAGIPFSETFVIESRGEILVDGSGVLKRAGFAIDGSASEIVKALQRATGNWPSARRSRRSWPVLRRQAGSAATRPATRLSELSRCSGELAPFTAGRSPWRSSSRITVARSPAGASG